MLSGDSLVLSLEIKSPRLGFSTSARGMEFFRRRGQEESVGLRVVSSNTSRIEEKAKKRERRYQGELNAAKCCWGLARELMRSEERKDARERREIRKRCDSREIGRHVCWRMSSER